MRYSAVASFALLLAACATTREQTATRAHSPRPEPEAHRHGRLAGLTSRELGELFGAPALQVREGPGLKLQWRGGGCVLDAYLYPPASGRGLERVTHVDARLASGADTDAGGCEAAIEAGR